MLSADAMMPFSIGGESREDREGYKGKAAATVFIACQPPILSSFISSMHFPISPAILYWGTPVVLVTSLNPDNETTNICAISSAFWLGHNCMLGFDAGSHTPQNIIRSKQCVLNLPSSSSTKLLNAINALASTTGTEKPSAAKLDRGYRYVRDKWSCTGLTPQPSDIVRPQRVEECPVQMECEFVSKHDLLGDEPTKSGLLLAIELRVLRVHVLDELRLEGFKSRIDPDKWRPIVMSFQQLYSLADGKLTESVLGKIDEEKYRPLTETSAKRARQRDSENGDDDGESKGRCGNQESVDENP